MWYFRTRMGDDCFPWRDHGHDHYNHNLCRNPNHKDGVWCFTGTGDAWDYCDVPKCNISKKLSQEEAQKKVALLGQKNMNVTIAEKNDYQVILTASIILMSVNFFLLIIIFTITVSWCRDQFCQKKSTIEENEMKRL